MEKRYLILLLPLSVLALAGLSAYLFFFRETPISVSLYVLVLLCVVAFTAWQSVFIQSSLVWDIDDLAVNQKAELAGTIVRDFVVYSVIHGFIASILFIAVYWVYGLF